MTRLVIFVAFVCAIVALMFQTKNKTVAFSNERFNLTKVENEIKAREDMLALMHAPVVAVVEEVVEEKMPEIVLDTPALKNGAEVYAKCILCHGKYGEGKLSQKAPRIGGQDKEYLEEQILDMQSGARVNQVMMPYVKALTAQDISDVSEYLSKYPWKK
jgi:cytochrome c553